MLGIRYLKRLGPLGTAMTLGQLAWLLRRHWNSIDPAQRARLRELVHRSNGDPRKLSPSERRELRCIIRDLRLPRLLLDAALLRRERSARLRP